MPISIVHHGTRGGSYDHYMSVTLKENAPIPDESEYPDKQSRPTRASGHHLEWQIAIMVDRIADFNAAMDGK